MELVAGMTLAQGLSAAGSVVSGVLGFASANYQAQVAQMNQEIAMENAARANTRGQEAAMEQDALTRGMLGEQIAAQSASGLSLSSGSAIKTRKAARVLGRKDAENVKEAGDIEAYNYKVDAANFGAQGNSARLSGMGSLLGGFLNAGTVLGGARATKRSYASNPSSRPTSLVI